MPKNPKDEVMSSATPAQNQQIQPESDLVANVPNYPASPLPTQEMKKQPKAKISTNDKDARDGMPVASLQNRESENIIILNPQRQEQGQPVKVGCTAVG